MHHVLSCHKTYIHATPFFDKPISLTPLPLCANLKPPGETPLMDEQFSFHSFVPNIVSECCWEKLCNITIWSQSPGMSRVSSMFHCLCLSFTFIVPRFFLLLNLRTFPTISSFSSLMLSPSLLFWICLFCELTPSVSLNFFCNFNLLSSYFPNKF